MIKRWITLGIKIGLAFSLLLGAQAIDSLTLPETKAASEAVYEPTYEWNINSANKEDFIIEHGRIMVPVRHAAYWFQMGVYTNDNLKTVTLLNHNHRIVFTPNSNTVNLDGKNVQLDAVPRIVKGRTYVSFRFLAQALGYTLGKRDKDYYISFKNPYVRGQMGTETYWMNKANGDLYYSNGTSMPKRIGKLNMQIFDMGAWGFKVKKVGRETIKISMSDLYGEPHLHEVTYNALLQKDRLLIESKTDYYGLLPHNNVKTYQGYLVFIDGHVANLVDPETGEVAQSYDMAALTGGDIEGRYVLEYVSDDILLIRPYHNSLLIMVNLESKQATLLYKELLTAEWQEILESWSQSDLDYPGDQLRFVKRWQNVFVFEFTDRFNGGKKTTYKYTMV